MNIATTLPPEVIVYPESDGKPLADNTKQLRWIVVLYCGLCAVFRSRQDVFVASNLMWYPVEGKPEVCAAPDVFVAIGRPRGDRGSYRQWEEGGVSPQVAFEVLSPGNDGMEMSDKLAFYTEHGVEEYYLYDPDQNRLSVFIRKEEALLRQGVSRNGPARGWASASTCERARWPCTSRARMPSVSAPTRKYGPNSRSSASGVSMRNNCETTRNSARRTPRTARHACPSDSAMPAWIRKPEMVRAAGGARSGTACP